MRIARTISITLLFSMLSWHIVFSLLFYTWYAAFGWFMALILALTALALEAKGERRARIYRNVWDRCSGKIGRKGDSGGMK